MSFNHDERERTPHRRDANAGAESLDLPSATSQHAAGSRRLLHNEARAVSDEATPTPSVVAPHVPDVAFIEDSNDEEVAPTTVQYEQESIGRVMGTRLPEDVMKRLTFATRDLKKNVASLVLTKERAATLTRQFASLKGGQLPEDIRRAGQAFEMQSLNSPFIFPATSFKLNGLIFAITRDPDCIFWVMSTLNTAGVSSAN